MFKMANIPVYTASDTSSGNRACAMLAELLGAHSAKQTVIEKLRSRRKEN